MSHIGLHLFNDRVVLIGAGADRDILVVLRGAAYRRPSMRQSAPQQCKKYTVWLVGTVQYGNTAIQYGSQGEEEGGSGGGGGGVFALPLRQEQLRGYKAAAQKKITRCGRELGGIPLP